MRPLLAGVAACLAAWGLLAPEAVADDSVRVAASERYRAGRVHRFVLGGGYRDLWQTPVELPVLDLDVEGGGLTPTQRFGGLQTAVLGFVGPDGRRYSFRGTDKDPSAVLDPALHDTVFRDVVQDQMAAQHPGGPLAAAVIAAAVGVPAVEERLVVMPDHPRLGEFREEFAGMVGSFFEYPSPSRGDVRGFLGASEILDHAQLYARLRRGPPDAVDAQAFLRARLLDLLLGDFDRHRKQWRWAKLPGAARYVPIPEDRDQAFVRYDGAGQRLAAVFVPILQSYGPRYPSMRGLALHGWEQDRWLLPSLAWPAWVEVIDALQASITDEVIEAAIAALPPEYAALDAERFRADVRGRRDRLRSGARAFYAHLAAEVDVQLSDLDEKIDVEQGPEGEVTVTVTASTSTTPVFRRRFLPDETDDVRIYARGGADEIRVAGPRGPIQVRILADRGAKTLAAQAGAAPRLYDPSGEVTFAAATDVRVDRAPYAAPEASSGFVDVEGLPPRDWGSETLPVPLLGADRDVGLLIGGGVTHTRFGFRKHPYASKHRLLVAWSTGANRPVVGYQGAFRFENARPELRLDLSLSGIEVMRFHGFGNETTLDGPDGFFRVKHQRYRAAPSVFLALFDDRLRLEAGPWFELSRTDRGDRLVDALAPYGAGTFVSAGAFARAQVDLLGTVEDLNVDLVLPLHPNPAAGYPTRGLFFDLRAKVGPPLLDVDSTWASLSGALSGFFGFGRRGRFVLGARVGAQRTFGRTPYFEAAYVGGGNLFTGDTTLRGYRAQRFGGHTALYGNLDLRVMLLRAQVVVPMDFGLTAFGDVGRVFAEEVTSGPEDSDLWHPSAGGGLWFAPLERTNTFTLTFAHSREHAVLAYFRAGFHY